MATAEAPPLPAAAPSSSRNLIADLASKYGLYFVLVAPMIVFGIKDLSDTGNLSRLATNIFEGLSNGSIWALIAVGYTLVYGIIELINFAHGETFMIGSFVSVAPLGHARADARHRAARPRGRAAADAR